MKPDIKKIKERCKEKLLGLPNVVAIGFGPKVIKGQLTGTMSIKVYVSDKVPKEMLADHESIPKEIEGVPTDVESQDPLLAY